MAPNDSNPASSRLDSVLRFQLQADPRTYWGPILVELRSRRSRPLDVLKVAVIVIRFPHAETSTPTGHRRSTTKSPQPEPSPMAGTRYGSRRLIPCRRFHVRARWQFEQTRSHFSISATTVSRERALETIVETWSLLSEESRWSKSRIWGGYTTPQSMQGLPVLTPFIYSRRRAPCSLFLCFDRARYGFLSRL